MIIIKPDDFLSNIFFFLKGNTISHFHLKKLRRWTEKDCDYEIYIDITSETIHRYASTYTVYDTKIVMKDIDQISDIGWRLNNILRQQYRKSLEKNAIKLTRQLKIEEINANSK